MLPYETYERYVALARQREQRLDWALSAAQSVQVELPGAFSPEHNQEVSAYVVVTSIDPTGGPSRRVDVSRALATFPA